MRRALLLAIALIVALTAASDAQKARNFAVICPPNIIDTTTDAAGKVETYTVTTSGGRGQITLNYSQGSGTEFEVGVTTVTVDARDKFGAMASCAFSVTLTLVAPLPIPNPDNPPPPIVTSGVGPQASITCPIGAVDIWPGVDIPLVIRAYPAGTTYCLRAGVHPILGSIIPKRGDIYVGESGAILDGSNWVTTDQDDGAFKALNQDIDFVVIRNLVIRKMPQYGIAAFYWMSDHWTIEYNELADNKFGIEFPPDSLIRNNYIYHNVSSTPTAASPQERGGGYASQHADRAILEGNEIAYNGTEQKVLHSTGVIFRNNFVHHNMGDGIWYDTNYTADALVEGNRVEDNGRAGIDIEATNGAIVRNNSIRRNGDDGVFIYRSQRVQTYGNTLEFNLGGVEYYISCDSPFVEEDLKDNTTHDNAITVAAQGTTWGAGLSFGNACTTAQRAQYMTANNLTFSSNTYHVPSAGSNYWLWNGWKSWAQWLAIPQDSGSTAN